SDLRRSGQAEQGGRALYLPLHRQWPVCRHPQCRNATGRRSLCRLSRIHEGRTMNLLGKLDWAAIPFHEPIIMGATAFMVLVVVAVLGFITMKGAWLYLWREWLTSVDHKRIGVMYCI